MPESFDAVSSTLGASTVRAAESLLRALGDGGITLRLPLPIAATNADLGLSAPLTEDVQLSPAILQLVKPEEDGRTRYEVAIAAAAVEHQVEVRNLEDANAFFDSALGIVAGGRLLRIINATPHACGGRVFLYRLQATG